MLNVVVGYFVVVVEQANPVVLDRPTKYNKGEWRTDATSGPALDRRNGWNGCRHTRSGQWGGVDCDFKVGGTGVDADCVGEVQYNRLASSKPG